ncbi:solute:sodium symporter (SSS) family transporter [Edaphobacter acidisoli]|uniref:Solute:sodium symporter (SSS) family transporter n=1 Tax=Edaphobacter acidisoli TaxID=2040573 RepID=A0A916RG95_9BACT|nr:sodium/solute symporter [Edaphobacter acidisoli]GGA55004.1 solute:sodium symporter (SSS) family transporter [Edaphobacter acidisoli]
MFGTLLNKLLFSAYLLVNVLIGLLAARRATNGSRGYFLAGESLPWYAIGGSIIAANISTEHFIGMVGAAYAAGFVVAQWEWGNWFTLSVLLWIFLPYYLRGGIYTMPEFLERRYNKTCRYIFAIASLVLWIVAQMSVVMLAGAKALEGMFGIDPLYSILGLALLAGSYTIYGGLASVAWTDFLQFLVLMTGGAIVAITGLVRTGGVLALMHAEPYKFKIIYPLNDPTYPWFGVFTLFLSIGIWYNCTNQFIVQRCLGARTEWDARMGVIFAGFMKILLPFLVVVPGIVAFKLFPSLPDPDLAYPTLVKTLVPAGLAGIVMAGIASALLSHLSSVVNSSSTIFTIDLYHPLLRPRATDLHLVKVGRWSSFVILILAVLLSLWLARGKYGVFLLIQNVGAWVAAPISVVFLLGALWRRASAAAATFILLFGFPYTAFVQYVLFRYVSILRPYDNFLNRTFLVWITCLILMVFVSLVTTAPSAEVVDKIVWSKSFLRLPQAERARSIGFSSPLLWWSALVCLALALYAYMIWFQFWGPLVKHG